MATNISLLYICSVFLLFTIKNNNVKKNVNILCEKEKNVCLNIPKYTFVAYV